ncbi:MAG: TRAP transporter large permease subunit [Peptococcaceae bacterium]|jgi:tripartite ATP-independent transporter DctM subunit|nr:TRAP transporter large permease subunit [Peptococcaceae bacterium]
MTAEMTTQLVIIIVILVTAIFSGAPVMAAIGGTAIIAMILFFDVPFFDHFARMAYQQATRAEFLISPLFLLMSEFLSKGGLAEDIFAVMHKLMNKIKGGLAMATTLACTIFAALCGSSPATAASVGVIATESMTRRKYRKDFAIGTVAGGGTLGIMIPPSMTLVGYGILTETSVAKLLIAGMLPGLMLSGLMLIMIFVRSRLNPALVGEVDEAFLKSKKYNPEDYAVDLHNPPPEAEVATGAEYKSLIKRVWPSFLLIIVVLGSLYLGITTATEAAAVGAVGAFSLTCLNKRMTKTVLGSAVQAAARTSCMMIFLMVGGRGLTFVLAYLGIPGAMTTMIAQSGLNRYVILCMLYVLWFILGCLMDPGSMSLLTVPFLFTTMTVGLGFDPIWLGIVSTLMTEVGMITPPVGLNIFVLRAATKIEIKYIIIGVWPYVATLLIGLLLLTLFPQIALFLPSMM